MTLSSPSRSRSTHHPAQPPRKVHFAHPQGHTPSAATIRPRATRDVSPARSSEAAQPKSWLQQYWEDFKLTNWWAVFVFNELFQRSSEGPEADEETNTPNP